MTDFPSSPSPQPGTVSKVITPQPIRTGLAFAENTGRARPNTMAKATASERLFMLGIPCCCLADSEVSDWPCCLSEGTVNLHPPVYQILCGRQLSRDAIAAPPRH